MREFDYIVIKKPREIATVNLDLSDNASRICIMDRRELLLLFASSAQANILRQVPLEYSRAPNLIIFMLDDTGNYNAVVADAVQAEFVSAGAEV
ncbi:hypothetical protein Q4519_14720 [Motilimonas sp. 1_MG-2023]|uniref:hypothetical protein n=1 Tax=Motilimonas sp. 1_MG-2023 TaxID=3062672 RepID=UPI0026E41BB8|nr:hypothetical protein [Motilimonas sp. 1_MG-2023]MDO6526937.1 hypothetical protein [Motilimonas sp. 1_MG-2023]